MDLRPHLGPGIHRISADVYHADPAPAPSLSSSIARILLDQSPLHAWTASPRLNPAWEPTESKTFDIGRAAHRAILGAGGDYVAIPEELLGSNGAASTKAAREWIENARARGLTPLKAHEVAMVETMADKAARVLAGAGINLHHADSEVVAVAEIDGVWCRAMLDNVPEDPRQPIYDIKTCESAAPEACLKSVLNYGYDVQAAHYLDTWKAATGEARVFRFIFQEKSKPHEVCVIEIGQDSLDLARRKVARAREMWGICLGRDEWPGYPLGVHKVDLPAWTFERWFERESAEKDHKRQHGADILEAAMRFLSPQGFKGATE